MRSRREEAGKRDDEGVCSLDADVHSAYYLRAAPPSSAEEEPASAIPGSAMYLYVVIRSPIGAVFPI
jgi:hypothetical protein